MSHDDKTHHEHLTIGEFFEEYWVLLFFGTFFLMTMFLPVLFSDNRNWFYWAIVIILAVAMALLTIPGFLSRAKHQNKK